jgi:anti-sigma B factor antagonist
VASEFAEFLGLTVAEHGPDARVVTVVGEVDTLTAPELATVLTAQLIAARLVVVDLDGVQFFGSAGLSVLFEANEFATEKDRVLRLVCHSQIVDRVLETTGLWQQFTLAENVRDALTDLP